VRKFVLILLVALAVPASASAYLSGGGGGMPMCNDGIIGATYETAAHDHYTCVFGYPDYWAWTGRY
jgi:hypothetical protein